MTFKMPQIDDKILIVPIGKKVKMIPSGAMPQVGDRIAVFEIPDQRLPDGRVITHRLITPGKSVPEEGEGAIIYPNPLANNDDVNRVIAITGGKNCLQVCNLPIQNVDTGTEMIFDIPKLPDAWFNPEGERFGFSLLIVPKDYGRSHGGMAYGNFKIVDNEGNDYTDYYQVSEWHGEVDEVYYLVSAVEMDIELNGKLKLVIKENGDGLIGVEGKYDQSDIIGFCSWGSGT
ncbi:MAG: hypothetical protein AMQ22_00059 [Candidatus Methanofastidiosum methylothiophilum]|uniref:Uncharacterized protein n=1 Tax=Candidatus Methanofastidiosum methylothiophilum TaxID=1705564 RepID=A0A150J9H9_9EURY|nr:MAG: hypothetical protein AMQ22_00059 [Candidatus Methanofastidiosum methylthiophilus]